ncbi:transporter substrate-binding domain-containing protein [Vibrio lentus]|nr:transporter substrate-binding domain-containing protein [Vibrio lentus]
MRNKQGDLVGFEIDVLETPCRRLAGSRIVPTAWDGIIPSLLSKKFDASSAVCLLLKRELKALFTEPYCTLKPTGC